MPSSFSRFLSEEELADVARLYEESLAALDDDFDAEEQDAAFPESPSTVHAPDAAGAAAGGEAASSEAAPPAGDTR